MGILKAHDPKLTERPLSFTAKNKNSEGELTVPAGYEIKSIELQNSNGEIEENLWYIIEEIQIAESLFSPLLKCIVRFKDNQNFFEEFSLSGKEILHIELTLLDIDGGENDINLTFVSEKYPTYIRSLHNLDSQEYICEYISPISFYSRLQTLSRSTNIPAGPGGIGTEANNPIDIVKDIYKKSLGVSDFKTFKDSKCDIKFKGVITKRTPLQATEWCLSKASEKNTPFFQWQSIFNGQFASTVDYAASSKRLSSSHDA